ncbi:tyrosine-type recombinase/integrase [Ekhidna sp.]
MASISISLKTPNNKTSPVWGTLSDGREVNFKVYPGITVKTNHWSDRKKCVLSADINAVEKNAFLENWMKQVMGIYLEAKSKGNRVSPSYIREQLKPKAENQVLTFWNHWDSFIESKVPIYTSANLNKFKSLRQHLKSFESRKKLSLDIHTIDKPLLEDLQAYLYSENGPKLQTGTVSRYLGFLKTFLNWCLERKLTSNTDYKIFKSIRRPDSLKVVLTVSDREKLMNISLGNSLSNVRDLLLLSCETGLRWSDYKRIKAHHYKKDSQDRPFIRIVQDKTEDSVDVPLSGRADSLVQKLIANQIRPISLQKMNIYVKELGRLAGLDEEFEKIEYRGKNKQVFVKKKYELITTHTGRRTFATDLLSRGLPAETVMKYTGHRDYKSFAQYVNIPKEAEMDLVRLALENTVRIA